MKTLTNLFIRSLLLIAVTSAQWSSDPASPQLLGSGVQAQVKATSDGGVYVAWLTDMGGYHVYLQRFDATGVAQFDEGGMLVSDHNNDSWIAVFHMNLAVDSDNNAIITVLDQRSGPWNVYGYKIAPDGSMLWGDDGVSVSNSSQTNYSPRLAVLPDNSVVVSWSPNSTTVEIQRISSDGDLMWGDGILIEDSNESLMSPQPIVNSNGDALVQWIGQSGPIWAADSKIYLQKYDLDGNSQWDNPAVAVGPVVFPMGNWSQQLVAEAGGGSFSAWTQFSGNVQNAVSQHITGEGAIAWTGGVDLSTNSSNFRMSPMLSLAEETQELMAVWKESNGSQSQRGISAQRLDSSGNQLWGSNGVTVVALNSSYDYLDLSVAGFGEELISAYIQQSANMDGDIYANRLDAEGNLAWTDETVTVTNTGTAKSDMMAGKGPNCLFIAWTENGSVYAHCLREDGTLGAPDVSSSDCTADDGTDGVELWGECYSIENTNSLNLSENGITGQIPSEIGNLSNLEVLVLWGNNLSGGIPFEIGNLTYLEVLSLSWNNLSGEIPSEIGNLSNLKELYLHHNNFSEQIPLEIGNLIGLEYLELQDNNLSGEIPPQIGQLINLQTLILHENDLTGQIPPEIGSLVNLIHLELDHNQLSGQIPPEIGNLVNLVHLELDHNQLSGQIPPEIGNLSSLSLLGLYVNQLSGQIPTEIWSLVNLNVLDLTDNNLTGEIPSSIGNLTNLIYLFMGDNNFSGPIPESIGNLQNIYSINISYNQFSGEIPESICNLGLDWGQWGDGVYNGISNNNLCPPYPECISPSDIGYQDLSNCGDVVELWGEYYSIEYTTELDLSGSGLIGPIPPEIGNLTNLTKLLLFDNNLVGEIPEEIGQLINLDYLHLRDNQLSGGIPAEIGNLINLTKLYLNKNQLTGEIPIEIGNLAHLTKLYLNENQLTGEIPLEIGNLIDLNKLYLNENQITGSIPPEIGYLSNLTGLYLNSNQLSGIIPDEICNQGDSSPNLSNNQLCPPYPSCIEEHVGEQDTTNCEQVSVINETFPITYNLYNAYPNPFNPITTLRYDLPEDALVNIAIYDMMGRIVKTMVNTQQNAGYKSIQWNATNNLGQPVSAGLYLYTIQAGKFRQTKKMVLLK